MAGYNTETELMTRIPSKGIWVLAAVLVAAFGARALAVPYASAVHNIGGPMWEFVLNESADEVTINRDGGNPVVLNNPAAGRHTFDLTGFSTFDIQVSKDTPAAWTEISDRSNLFTHFFRPNGVVVNTDPSSAYFGTIYVSHPIETFDGDKYGYGFRTAGDGIHPMTADMIGVDLASNFAVVTDVNDPSQAKAPGWTVDQSTSSSPWRISLDESNNIIAADWSDQSGGVKWASPDLSTGGLVLAFEDGGPGGSALLINNQGQEVHGSIFSKPMVTGSVGSDLTLWAIDEDYDLDGDTFTDPDGDGPIPASQYFNSLWRWDVGAATEYDGAPTLEVSSDALNVGETKWYSTIKGVQVDAHYEPQFGKFYMTQSRTHGNQSSLVIVSPDGVDGTTPDIVWSSREWSLAHGLDGAIPNVSTPVDTLPEVDGVQDIFRSIEAVTISPDGKFLYAHRAQQFDETSADGDNPYLGGNSPYPGGILIIPLDENGIPILDIDDNGTPEDTTDDVVLNLQSISMEGEFVRHIRGPISLDAAGNVYVTNNISEIMQVFSPGGNTLAITGSNGTFSLQTVGGGLIGDYNENGVVDAADYTTWRNNLGTANALPNDPLGGTITQAQYDQWKAHFGESNLGSGSGQLASGSVPEPAAGILLVLGVGCGLFSRRLRSVSVS